MALRLSSAARLASPDFGNIEQLGQDIGSLSARRRQRGMLTDLLGPALDPMATPEQLRQSVSSALQIGERELASQIAARLSAEEQAAQLEKGRANLETAAIAKARRDGAGEGVIAGLKGMSAEDLRTYLTTPKAREILTGTPGTRFFEKTDEGALTEVARVPFKPEPTKAPKIDIREMNGKFYVFRDGVPDPQPYDTEDAADKELKRIRATEGVIVKATSVINSADKAIQLLDSRAEGVDEIFKALAPFVDGQPIVGGFASILEAVPGTAARDLLGYLTTIKSNVGFDQLLDIKGLGGTLGQVSNIENILLQSTLASLDTGQTPETLRENLKLIMGLYSSIQAKARFGADSDITEWGGFVQWDNKQFANYWEQIGGSVEKTGNNAFKIKVPKGPGQEKERYVIITPQN